MSLPQTDPIIETPGNWKQFFINWLKENTHVVLLFILFMSLSISHTLLIHYNRPAAAINWNEGMITGTFTALIAKLK